MHLAVDQAKADRQIHAGEVSILNECQRELGMTDEELEMIHYMSFQECISALEPLSKDRKNEIIACYEKIIEPDYISREEV